MTQPQSREEWPAEGAARMGGQYGRVPLHMDDLVARMGDINRRLQQQAQQSLLLEEVLGARL